MSDAGRIAFNTPYSTGRELEYLAEAQIRGRLAGDGVFTQRCHAWIEKNTHSPKALLTHSCTAALEMTALLLEVGPGDEVIMPSYTFVSTANAFVLRGAVPVFVDVREDTLNIDERLIEPAITDRTKVIVPVHYGGVACAMDAIMSIAHEHDLAVVEDAAQGVMARYHGRALGSIGDLGTYSFHETKNVISGEGGAILVNRPELGLRAEIIREKGTDRSRFFRGEVDKYTWQDIGSSFLPSEIIAAYLWAQLTEASEITRARMRSWDRYHGELEELEQAELLRRPVVPAGCEHNAHLYYVLLPDAETRTGLLEAFAAAGIGAVFHYLPLHSSPAGRRYTRTHGSLSVTESSAERLVRLPISAGLSEEDVDRVLAVTRDYLFK